MHIDMESCFYWNELVQNDEVVCQQSNSLFNFIIYWTNIW